MKKITLILIAALYCTVTFAQTGATCNDAIPETAKSTCTFTSYTTTGSEMWFEFTATSTEAQIRVISEAFGTNTPHVHGLSLFGGTCASPNLIAEDELAFIDIANDLTIDASGLIPGNTYHIKADVIAKVAACTRVACPGTTIVSFVLCIQNINVFQPLDFNLVDFGVQEIPSPSHTYHTNRGQIVDTDGNPRRDIKLYTIGAVPNVYVTDNTLSYVFSRIDADTTTIDTLHRVDMTLVGGNPGARVFKTEKTPGYLNYFLPHIPNGIINMKGYSKAICNGVYPNIDMQLYSNSEGMKYYFITQPGGNADDIVMKYTGADQLVVTPDGGLRIETPMGNIEFDPGHAYCINPGGNVVPMPWQAKFIQVSAKKVKFDIRTYPSFMPLIVQVDRGHKVGAAEKAEDWSSYLGTSSTEIGTDVVTDNSGNVYFLGETGNPNFPNTTGSVVQDTLTGSADAYVLKFDSDGVSVWGTYYGGTGPEYTKAIALNSIGDVYFVGETNSSDFPVIPSGSTTLNTVSDGFIVRLNNTGTTAKWARYFGGDSSDDELRDVAVDGADNVYVVGMTMSTGSFPIKNKTGAYNQSANSGLGDGFIAKYDNANNQVWGSFFGGSSPDNFSAIVVGANNDIFISGSTNSTTAASSDLGNTPCDVPNSSLYFPDCDASGAAYIQSWGGGSAVNHDAIIVQFDSASVLRWSTYVGGLGNESSQIALTNSIAIHPSDPNTIYLVCSTDESTNLPITGPGTSYVQNAPIFATNNMAYIAKFNFRFLNWGSLFGCGAGDFTRGLDVTVDNSGNVYMTGHTRCDVPTTTLCDVPPAGEFPICQLDGLFFQDDGSGNAQFGGGVSKFDGYIAGFNSSNELIWSTPYGGNADETVFAITYDAAFDRIYLTGRTQSTSNFPLLNPQTGNYMQNTNKGGTNNLEGFIARFSVDTTATPLSVSEFAGYDSENINVFPNPTESVAYITLNSAKKVEVSIYNTLGALLYNRAHQNQRLIELDMSDFAKGVYFVKLIADEQNYFSKVIKK